MENDPNQPAEPATTRDPRAARGLHGEWYLAVEHARAAVEHARAVYADLKAQIAAQLAEHARAVTETRAAVRDQLHGRRIVITPDSIAQAVGAVLGALDAEPRASLDAVDTFELLDRLDALARLPGSDLAAFVADAFTRATSSRSPF